MSTWARRDYNNWGPGVVQRPCRVGDGTAGKRWRMSGELAYKQRVFDANNKCWWKQTRFQTHSLSQKIKNCFIGLHRFFLSCFISLNKYLLRALTDLKQMATLLLFLSIFFSFVFRFDRYLAFVSRQAGGDERRPVQTCFEANPAQKRLALLKSRGCKAYCSPA